MAVPGLVAGAATGTLVTILGALGRWLLAGFAAKLVASLFLNAFIFGAMFVFYKNFANMSMEFALQFFNFFGFGGMVSQIQMYYSQLPASLTSTLSYFQLGALVGFIVNNYIGGIFLAWIMRKFG
jgi:hypothetical protein